jgi:DNA invertase Pin-like site-specific DNA recombinase
MNNQKKTKAFLIARVSDESQRDALPAQELRLKNYAESKGLDYEIFSFDESAYKEDRQEFMQIIDMIATHPAHCVVVFDKIDRYTRDASSEVVQKLKNLVRKNRIELHFPSDNLFISKDSPAADRARLGMMKKL